jgi:gliding motility-associated-like protein
MKYFIAILSITLSYLSVFSQTGKYIPFANSLIYSVDGQITSKKSPGIRQDAFYQTYVVTGYDGKLRFTKSSTLTDAKGTQIYKEGRSTREDLNIGFELKPNVYLVFTAKEPYCRGCDMDKTELVKREVHYSPDNGSIVIVSEESIYTGKIMVLDIIPDTLGGHWVCLRNLSSEAKFFYFNKETYPLNTTEMDLLPSKIANRVGASHNGCPGGIVSPSGNYMVVNNAIILPSPTGNRELDEYRWKLDLYAFDKIKGTLSFYSNIIDTTTIGSYFFSTPFQVSSDDQYVYISKDLRKSPVFGSDLFDVQLQRYHIGANKIETLFNLNNLARNNQYPGRPASIQILDKDRYIVKRYNYSGSLDSTFVLDFIKNPNTAMPDYEPNAFISKVEFSNQQLFFGNSPYNYIRVKPSYTYDCAGHVTFADQSDYALPNTTVNYFSEDIAGSGVLIPRGENPTIHYTKNGDYLCKVILKSHEGTYKEIHYDTLKIRIPEKPVAAFKAADTVICAYVPLEFYNISTTDTVNKIQGEKWVWTFGDGTSETYDTPPPWGGAGGGAEHVYTRPGTYTVSLFYTNGFFDSTLVKNQYIKVVDAPAPGFTIDNNRGCSPFTVNIIDTVTLNTIKKEYNYYDGRGWVDIPVSQANFSQTYPDAGNYWITQRLYGYTSCVTQLDSQRIFVTPGFTKLDSSHITNATYQDVPAHPTVAEIITVNWPCLLEDAPVSYRLYRNNQKIAELDPQPCIYGQLVYQDSLEQVSNSLLTYTVLVIDSCGTAAQVGRVGQPVRVSGEIVGNNELSVISYTAYQDWNVGESELSYELQTEDLLGNWKTINDQTGTARYSDKEFLSLIQSSDPSTPLRMKTLEKCYRVVARLGTSKASISNVLCLPYTPVVFMPTAFSPNGDNLNDVYRPVVFGIEHYEVDIYNRYGQKVIHFTEKDAGWAAEDVAMGAYMVIIRAKGTDNEWYNLKSTVTLVR